MFDVDWSDPNRESVGDRRARKQKEKEISDKASSKVSNKDNADKDSKRDEQSSQASGSGSVRSSMSSVDKQFGFFGGKNRKKGRALGNSKSAASSTTGAPTIHEQEPTEDIDNNIVESPTEASSHVPKDSELVNTEVQHPGVSGRPHGSKPLSQQHHPQLPAHTARSVFPICFYIPHAPPDPSTINHHNLLQEHIVESTNNTSGFPEALFNTWNENPPGGSLLGYDMASPKPGLKSTLTQHLGDGISFITKTTEVRSQPRDKNDRDYLVSKVTLSAASSEHEPKDVSAKPT